MHISGWASARAGGLAKASGGQALGMGTEVGPSLSLLADQGTEDADTGDSCSLNSGEGQLYLAPGRWGLKAPHNSGLAPHAAEPGWICFLGQDSKCYQWGPGSHQSAGVGVGLKPL